jgi:hypothetical protein
MKTRARMFAAAISAAGSAMVLNNGCGLVESASYQPGDLPKGETPPGAGVPLVSPQSSSPSETSVKLRDLTFDTGLMACVGGELSSKKQWIFKPIKYNRSLQEFMSLEVISNWNEFFEAFDLVLREIVEPKEGLVAYSQIREGKSLGALWVRLRTALADLPLSGLRSDDERKAFWLNVYNFLMIDTLRENPSALVSSQRAGTFSRKRHGVAGSSVTLDQIEYGVLRLGGRNLSHPFPAATVPTTIDSRLHVALVCGAKGCPKLRNFAYEDEHLDSILNENVHMFMNDQVKHVAYDPQSQSIRLSELFQWFAVDFNTFAGGSRPSDVKRYVLKGCRNDKEKLDVLFDGIDSFSKLGSAQKIPYDWTPNELVNN